MKTKFSLILTLLFAFVVQFSFAQEKTISGKVSDQNNLPLPGVTVLIQGTTSGTQTDFDGNYSINASSGAVLSFSYLGMKSQDVTVGDSSTINVSLMADNAVLDEVLVTGYGTSTKNTYTGSAKTVKAENLEIKNVNNVSTALAGEVAGVRVINSSGQPGTSSSIRIRGYGSVNGNRAPLYVLDGVPFSGSLNQINPNDIASTTVLKDAAATSIYGARGANGVILITTKSGSSNESFIDVDFKTGINTRALPRYDVISNPEEYIGYVWEGIYNRGAISGEADPVAYANDNLFTLNYLNPGYNMWNVSNGAELIDPETRTVRPGVTRRYTPGLYSDAAFDDAIRQEASIRMGGGNATTNYYLSLGYLDDQGYALNSSYERTTLRMNVKSQLRDWVKVGANIGYGYSRSKNNGQTNGSENVFEFADKMAPIFPVFLRDNDGNFVADPIFGGNQYDYGGVSWQDDDGNARNRPNANNLNPIASALYDKVGGKSHLLDGTLNMDITLSDNLTFETKFGSQYSTGISKSYSNPFYGTSVGNGGDLAQTTSESLTQNFLQMLRYTNEFGDHSVQAILAHETNESTYRQQDAYKGLVVIDGLLELDNFVENLSPPGGYSQVESLESFFANVDYSYMDKYYLGLSARRDGSSRFVNEKWGNFWSVSGAWLMSKEDFLADSSLVNFLKLKASYGINGDKGGVGLWSGYDTFAASLLDGNIAIAANSNGNPDLTWEEATQFNIGAEFSLGSFLDGTLEYYDKVKKAQIFGRRVGPSQGIAVVTVNDGELRNAGLEFDLTGHLVDSKDFNLDLTLNGEVLTNEFKQMPLEPSTGEPRVLDVSASPYAWSQGSSLFDFYLREWAGVDPTDGAPMWYQYFNDANGNGTLDADEDAIQSMTQYLSDNPDATVAKQITKTYSEATDKYVGKSGIADLRGAIRLAGNYKNWTFSTQFTYSIGGWAYDYQYAELMSDRFGALGNNFHKDINDRWQRPGDVTNVPRLADGIDQNSTSSSTRFLTKTDYIALNNAQIGYTLPAKFLENTGIDGLNLWVSGDNLFVKSARDGYVPDASETGNTGRRFYAPLSTYTLGVRLKF
jgi:TonB-linked SusC/RagA family outer membrane protein